MSTDFWKQVDVREMRECWLWQGALANGYGFFRNETAHRFAWSFIYGEVPRGLFILHSCDTPQCVNPRHLRAGTHEENTLDKTVLSRVRAAIAEAELAARERRAPKREPMLTQDVSETRRALAENLRRLRAERGLSMQSLGDIVGVVKSQIHAWETDGIPTGRLDAVAGALGVSVAELLS